MNYYILVKSTVGLVPKKVAVKGKTKVYQAIRYISTGEKKKRVQEFLGEKHKSSKYSRYMKKSPEGVDIVSKDELIANIEPTPKGKRYFYGVEAGLIKRAIMFEKPEEIDGCVGIIEKADGSSPRRIYTDDILAKRNKKKHQRVKKLGGNLPAFIEDYTKLMNGKKPGLGAALALMHQHQVRVGGSAEGRDDHFGSTTLKVNHVVDIKDNKQASDLSKKIMNDRITPFIKSAEEAQKIEDPVKKEKTLVRIEKNKQAEIEKVKAMGVPKPGELWLDFVGKSGVLWSLNIQDPLLKKTIRNLVSGRKEDDLLFGVNRAEVAKRLRKYKIIPKDFRTWAASKAFVEKAKELDIPQTQKEFKIQEKQLVTFCSMKLWNKPGICKKAYIDPAIIENWRAGILNKMERVQKSFAYVVME